MQQARVCVTPGAGDWRQGGLQGAGHQGFGRRLRAAAAGDGARQPLPVPQLRQHWRRQPLVATNVGACSRSSSSSSVSDRVHCALTAQRWQRSSAHGWQRTRPPAACRCCRHFGMAAGCWAAASPALGDQSAQGQRRYASAAAESQPLCTAAHTVHPHFIMAATLAVGHTASCMLGQDPCARWGVVSKGMYFFPWQMPALSFLQHQLGAFAACDVWAAAVSGCAMQTVSQRVLGSLALALHCETTACRHTQAGSTEFVTGRPVTLLHGSCLSCDMAAGSCGLQHTVLSVLSVRHRASDCEHVSDTQIGDCG